MTPEQQAWYINGRIFDYLRLPALTWLEVVLIVLGLSALAIYLAVVVHLDQRLRSRLQRRREAATVARWLAEWRLLPEEEAILHELARDETPQQLYGFLQDPVRFETEVDRAFRRWPPNQLGFLAQLRRDLNHFSDNLRKRLVSTRQISPGDAVRVALWEAGVPQFFYGHVQSTDEGGFTLLLGGDAVRSLQGTRGEIDLFLLRGNDSEYPFAFRPQAMQAERGLARLQHGLLRSRQQPRQARLPILLPLPYEARAKQHSDAVDDLDPDTPPAQSGEGRLLDLSEGGCAFVVNAQIVRGWYLHFTLPSIAKGVEQALTGRLLDCRPFPGGGWVARCSWVGLAPSQRSYLLQLVRMGAKRRSAAQLALRERSTLGQAKARNAAKKAQNGLVAKDTVQKNQVTESRVINSQVKNGQVTKAKVENGPVINSPVKSDPLKSDPVKKVTLESGSGDPSTEEPGKAATGPTGNPVPMQDTRTGSAGVDLPDDTTPAVNSGKPRNSVIR